MYTGQKTRPDRDADELPDYRDPDDDADGRSIPTGVEHDDDIDGDGIPNYLDDRIPDEASDSRCHR